MAAKAEIERIRERIDAIELIGSYVPLKKAGRSFKACCPFHQEKTPSFVVFPDTQSFHCFGCGQGGDIFTFLMKIEGLEFSDALARLAARAGVELTERGHGAPPLDAHRQRLYEATATAAAFFAHVLRHAAAGAPGRALLAERGINATSVEVFGLGFAPDSWDALRKHLTERAIPEAVAIEAGLLTENTERGSVYDRFRNRLIFPIRDREGRVLGFGGRALGNGQPKYLNSPQSPIFDKSAILYGIDVAAPAIRQADAVVLVEGYVDAIMAHQCGYANVVANMGTALTEQQVRLLKPLTKRLVLALDADTAGQMATLRGIETLRTTLADEVKPVPDARGMIRHELRLSAEIRVLTLPAGEDPDSLLRKEPAAWPGLVEQAQPLLDYVIQAVLSGIDLTQPRAKSEAVDHLAPLLSEIGDIVQQAHYVNILSRRLGLDERVIFSRVRASVRRAARQEVQTEAAEARAPFPREDYLLGLLLRYPEVAAGLTEQIGDEDFVDVRNRLIWEQLRERLPGQGTAAVAGLLADLDATVAEHARGLLARQQAAPELPPARVREEVVDALKLVRRRLDERRAEFLQGLLRDVEAGGDGLELAAVQRELAALVDSARQRSYYPRPSPYFKDIRDKDL